MLKCKFSNQTITISLDQPMSLNALNNQLFINYHLLNWINDLFKLLNLFGWTVFSFIEFFKFKFLQIKSSRSKIQGHKKVQKKIII